MVDIAVTRILSMEDDPGLSRLLQKSLQRRGYVVDTAADGEEGLARVEAGQYDLLLVDYDMPFCGGLDVLRKLLTRGGQPPTIMVTGQGNEEVAVEALKLGATDYIVKDVEMKYLELLPVVIDRAVYQQHLLRESRRMAEAVRESEERFRLLVEHAPDGIAVHAGGRIVFLNPAGTRILGAGDPAELIGRPIVALFHPAYRERAQERARALEERGGSTPWTVEKFVRLDDTEVDVEISSVSFSQNGKPAVQLLFRDVSARKQMEAQLEQLALYDALTGLPNRTLFFDRIRNLLALAKRNKDTFGLLYVDLDRFRTVNETLGHEAGDRLLAEAGQRMLACTRQSDTVARLSGDEFIGICARIASPNDASIVAEKITAALSEPFLLFGQSCRIGASIGISLFPQDGDDIELLLRSAEAAMKRIKQGGRGGFAYSSGI